MRVLMLAAENDALPHAKVGGVGDVLRDVPEALAESGVDVDIILPDYADYQSLMKSEQLATIELEFAGRTQVLTLLKLWPLDSKQAQNKHLNFYALSHDTFAGEAGQWVYTDDDEGPFATDATKFALFCQGVLEALHNDLLPRPDKFHFHDWHAAFATILLEYEFRYSGFKRIPRVFSIHNLSLQGIRPITGMSSSLYGWYRNLKVDMTYLVDPRYPDCINPMRAAIHYCDKIHVVSPSYADEVQRPSDPSQGFFGGEGLHEDLQIAAKNNKLVGILNGCKYDVSFPEPMSYREFLVSSQQSLFSWMALKDTMRSAHFIAFERVRALLASKKKNKPFIASFVGRLTSQKVALLMVTYEGKTVLEHILDRLKDINGVALMMGSGDANLERKFTQVMAKYDNLIFLNGYTAHLSEDLYALGDLFLMPSSFEPCGISQMLSMRRGQPCLVHHVGGLKDTVIDGVNGFAFTGSDVTEQCNNLLASFDRAVTIYLNDPEAWQQYVENAKAARFSWQQSVEEYLNKLYV